MFSECHLWLDFLVPTHLHESFLKSQSCLKWIIIVEWAVFPLVKLQQTQKSQLIPIKCQLPSDRWKALGLPWFIEGTAISHPKPRPHSLLTGETVEKSLLSKGSLLWASISVRSQGAYVVRIISSGTTSLLKILPFAASKSLIISLEIAFPWEWSPWQHGREEHITMSQESLVWGHYANPSRVWWLLEGNIALMQKSGSAQHGWLTTRWEGTAGRFST